MFLLFWFITGSPATSLSSLSAAAASLRPSSHALTPSLAAYYRPDLISHVTGWQAEHLEKQVMTDSHLFALPILVVFIASFLFLYSGHESERRATHDRQLACH